MDATLTATEIGGKKKIHGIRKMIVHQFYCTDQY